MKMSFGRIGYKSRKSLDLEKSKRFSFCKLNENDKSFLIDVEMKYLLGTIFN